MLHNIPPAVFDALPDNLKLVPKQVLDITGIETKALPFTTLFLEEQPDFARAEAVLDIDPDRHSITIWYAPEKVTASTIGHELIHLRRNIVEAVPKIFPTQDTELARNCEVLFWENELEHLIIVPEQLNAFSEARAWWVEHYSSMLDRDKTNHLSLMFAWSFIRNVLPAESELANCCANLLHKYKIAEPADYLRADLKKAMTDKAELIRSLLRFFSSSNNQVAIARYLVINHELTVEPVDL